jgi:ribonuclease PH
MTDKGDFVEVQGSGEESVFSTTQLDSLLTAARSGIAGLLKFQSAALLTKL